MTLPSRRSRRSENVRVHPVIVAELELGNRHKWQSFGNKPDRQGLNVFRRPFRAVEFADPFNEHGAGFFRAAGIRELGFQSPRRHVGDVRSIEPKGRHLVYFRRDLFK
jgi:hypothetical protein